MKPFRLFGLALVAALATMALVGAGTASAVNVALCKEKAAVCGNRYEVGQKFEFENQGQGKLKSPSIFGTTEVSCQKRTFAGEITETQGERQVKGEITEAKFEECGEINSEQTQLDFCTVTTVQLPWTVHINQNAEQDGNGVMWIGPHSGGGQPGAKFECPNQITGTFKAKETQPEDQGTKYGAEWISLVITGGNPAKVTANQAPLKGPLGAQAFWTIEYEMVEPETPLFVTQQ